MSYHSNQVSPKSNGEGLSRLITSYRSRGNVYPQIQLRGAWLRELGYEVGQEIEVLETREGLLIQKNNDHIEAENGLAERGEKHSLTLQPRLIEEYKVCVRLERPTSLPRQRTRISKPADVAQLCEELQYRDREVLWSIYLDTMKNLVGIEETSVGTLNSSLVHPREVYKGAILSNASTLIVAHNHPSGGVEPSREDIKVTERLSNAGEILGIQLLDHLIIGYQDYRSLKEAGFLGISG